jgi:hypothetical protein
MLPSPLADGVAAMDFIPLAVGHLKKSAIVRSETHSAKIVGDNTICSNI